LYLCIAQLLIERLEIAQPAHSPACDLEQAMPGTGSGRTANTVAAVARTRAAQNLKAR